MSEEQVNVVTLAHLKLFTGDRHFEPIFRALRIDKAGEIRRLLWIAERLDYVDADNPAAEAEFIATTWHLEESHHQKSNFSWIIKCAGFVVGVLLLYRGTVLIWRQRL